MSTAEVAGMLDGVFPSERIKAVLKHYSGMVEDYLNENWEDSLAKAGKFVEATLKTLAIHCGVSLGKGRAFKADTIINALPGLSQGTVDDSIRLTIPRACRFTYDIASNRGGRHDPDEIDPNHMDANVVVNVSAWILADLIRYAQKGAIDPNKTKQLIESLTSKKYPFIEEIDGRVYVHLRKKSAVNVALVILARSHPQRIGKKELVAALEHNGYSTKNARMALSRTQHLVDNDGNDQIRLLAPGLKRAEEIMKTSVEAIA